MDPERVTDTEVATKQQENDWKGKKRVGKGKEAVEGRRAKTGDEEDGGEGKTEDGRMGRTGGKKEPCGPHCQHRLRGGGAAHQTAAACPEELPGIGGALGGIGGGVGGIGSAGIWRAPRLGGRIKGTTPYSPHWRWTRQLCARQEPRISGGVKEDLADTARQAHAPASQCGRTRRTRPDRTRPDKT